jgi:flagellar biosynthesis GTPase FlhF
MNVALQSPTIGDNSAAVPLAEILAEETAALEKRALDLAGAAGRAAVTDDETAGKATLLAKMINEHRTVINKTRIERKEPFLVGGRTVDQHFSSLDKLLADTDAKGKIIGGPLAHVVGLIDTYRREQEAKAAAERRRLEEEARKQREAAEAAERARREAEERAAREAEEAARKIAQAEAAARAAGNAEAAAKAAQARAEEETRQAAAREASMRAEIEARQRQEQAEALERQAQAVTAAPIDSGFGPKASGRKTYTAEITDLTVALRHARKVDEAAIRTAVQGIYDRQVRAGVRELPGATVHESSSTVIR